MDGKQEEKNRRGDYMYSEFSVIMSFLFGCSFVVFVLTLDDELRAARRRKGRGERREKERADKGRRRKGGLNGPL